VAVVDDEIDLASLFKDALSQIPNIRVLASSDPMFSTRAFSAEPKKLQMRYFGL
jgi:hypothetical protein